MQIFEVGDGRCEVEVTETQDRGGSVAARVSFCGIGERPGSEEQRGVLEKQAEADRSRLSRRAKRTSGGVDNIELGRCVL